MCVCVCIHVYIFIDNRYIHICVLIKKKNHRTIFPHNSGGWKSKIKMSAYLVSPEVPLPGLADSCLPVVGSHGLFSMCEPV